MFQFFPTEVYTVIVHELLGCDPGPCRVRLVQDVEYTVPDAPPPLRRFTVPAGFVYDRATMPLPVRWVIDRDRLDPAALAHDYAIESADALGASRREADRLFLAVARATPGLSAFKAWLAYLAVRAFSLLAR